MFTNRLSTRIFMNGFQRVLVVALFILGFVGQVSAQPGFEERKARLLDVLSGEDERSFYAALAKLRMGKDTARAFSILDSLTTDKAMGGMFYSYTLIGTYLHTRDVLPDSLHRKIREAYRNRTMYRGDTENHWVMYYTGLYLAAQTWPGEDGSRWFNGKSSDENFRESKEWLERWMHITTTIGQGEFDSPTYSTVFITPMLVLYEFAADKTMKTRAQMMLDLLFVDFAAEELGGNYGGGHSRDYPEDIINPLAAPITRISWLYFGLPDKERWDEARYRPRNQGSWETVFAALGSYRLPDIIYRIGTDRSVPYIHTETKRVRNEIRFSDQMNPPVYKYTYMTPDYVIGSLQGGILQPIQQHTWDVTWLSDQPNNTLFTLHPFFSGKELAMFFPEEQKFLSEEVDRYHKVYTNPDKWNSSSPYEQTMQYKDALIVLYNIDKDAKQQHVDGFFPKNLDQRVIDSTGWIFCKAGKTYIAFFPLKPYSWTEETVNWRWRSTELKNGAVVQVGAERVYGSFEKFQDAVRKSRLQRKDFDRTLTVAYTTPAGDALKFTYGGDRSVNGKKVDFKDYHLFNGPFVKGDVGAGIITLQYKGHQCILNFNTATIVEQ
jgi:hypothetical protein